MAGTFANWVEQEGGLPPAIHRLAKKLKRKGHDEASAIAIAVAAAKRFAPDHPAWAKAVGQWEGMRARARAHESAKDAAGLQLVDPVDLGLCARCRRDGRQEGCPDCVHDSVHERVHARQDRPLRGYEHLMQLDAIEHALDTARDRVEHAAGGHARQVARSAVEGRSDRPHRDAVRQLEEAIAGELADLYATGRRTVSDELVGQGGAPSIYSFADGDWPGWLAKRAALAAAGIVARVAQLVGRLSVGGRKTPAEIQMAAETEAAAALKSEAQFHAAAALNQGRADAAEDRADEIRGARYTSILDKNRCEQCDLADDDVLRPLNDPVRLKRRPPNPDCHGGDRCRCMEFFQLKTEDAPSFAWPFDRTCDAPSREGVMVALYPTPEDAGRLAIPRGEPAAELHLTLAYLGKTGDMGDGAREGALEAVRRWAHLTGPLDATISGVGVFTEGDEPVTYWSVDAPGLPAAREALVHQLREAGVPPSTEHGFTPHITVAFARRGVEPPKGMDITFGEVTVAWGDDHVRVELAGDTVAFEWQEGDHPRDRVGRFAHKLAPDVVEGGVATGVYYPTGHERHADDQLTQEIRRSKAEPDATAHEFASRIGEAARQAFPGRKFDIVATPPSGGVADRLGVLRAGVAEELASSDAGPVVRELFDVPGYRQMTVEQRRATRRGRFSASTAVAGKRVLLVDDVVTSGVQAQQARQALLDVGAASVDFVAVAEAAYAPEDDDTQQLAGDAAMFAFDPDQPRDDEGRWTHVRSLGGTTGAELYRTQTGRQVVVKRGADPGHLREEHDADEAYRALGIPVPDAELAPGPAKIARYLEGARPLAQLHGDERRNAESQVRRGFVADAVLGNWDVVGLERDNILWKDGVAWRVDNGGALRRRAQGALKPAFPDVPTELWTMREKGQAGRVFGKIPWHRVMEQARELLQKRTLLETALSGDVRPLVAARLDALAAMVALHDAGHSEAEIRARAEGDHDAGIGGLVFAGEAEPGGRWFAVDWNPKDHPRDENGRFRVKVGAQALKVLQELVANPNVPSGAKANKAVTLVKPAAATSDNQSEVYVSASGAAELQALAEAAKTTTDYVSVAEQLSDVVHETANVGEAADYHGVGLTPAGFKEKKEAERAKLQPAVDALTSGKPTPTVGWTPAKGDTVIHPTKGKGKVLGPGPKGDPNKVNIMPEGSSKHTYWAVSKLSPEKPPAPKLAWPPKKGDTVVHPTKGKAKVLGPGPKGDPNYVNVQPENKSGHSYWKLDKLKPADGIAPTPVGSPPATPVAAPKPKPAVPFAGKLTGDPLRKKLVQWQNPILMTTGEQAAIRNYTASGYTSINKAARGKGISSQATERKIKDLDSALAKATLPEDIVVHRGVKGSTGKMWTDAEEGQYLRDLGFGSTSVNESFAKNWGLVGGDSSVLTILLPKGARGLWVGAKGGAQGSTEGEVLLPRGMKFRVVKRGMTKGGRVHIWVQAVPDVPPPVAFDRIFDWRDQPRDPGGEEGGRWVKGGAGAAPVANLDWLAEAYRGPLLGEATRWSNALTPLQRRAIANYKAVADPAGGVSGPDRPGWDAVDDAARAGQLPVRTMLHRAVTIEQDRADKLDQLAVGDEFDTDGKLMPTSLDREIAETNFGHNVRFDPDEKLVLLHIDAPASTPAGFPDGFSEDMRDQEVLLPSNSRFKVTGRRVEDSETGQVTHLDVELLPT